MKGWQLNITSEIIKFLFKNCTNTKLENNVYGVCIAKKRNFSRYFELEFVLFVECTLKQSFTPW